MPTIQRFSLSLFLLSLVLISPISQAQPFDFSLKDLNGKQVNLSDYRGQWVVVNFWASWCGPCIKEMPELIAFQKDNPGTRLLGVNFEDTDAEHSKKFLERFDINFPNLKIGSIPLVPMEPLKGLPSTFFINPNGELVNDHIGPITAPLLEKKLASPKDASSYITNL